MPLGSLWKLGTFRFRGRNLHMHTFTITIRRVGTSQRVVAEAVNPEYSTISRNEEEFHLDREEIDLQGRKLPNYESYLRYGTTLGSAVFVGKVAESFHRAVGRVNQT